RNGLNILAAFAHGAMRAPRDIAHGVTVSSAIVENAEAHRNVAWSHSIFIPIIAIATSGALRFAARESQSQQTGTKESKGRWLGHIHEKTADFAARKDRIVDVAIGGSIK